MICTTDSSCESLCRSLIQLMLGQGVGTARLTGKKMQTASCCNHPAHSLANECLLKIKTYQDISRLSRVSLFSVFITSVGACCYGALVSVTKVPMLGKSAHFFCIIQKLEVLATQGRVSNKSSFRWRNQWDFSTFWPVELVGVI